MKKIFITLLILSSFSAIGINKYTFEKLILLNSSLSGNFTGFLSVDQNQHKFLANTFDGHFSYYTMALPTPAISLAEFDQNDNFIKSKGLVDGDTILTTSLKFHNDHFYLMLSFRDKLYFGNDTLTSKGKSDVVLLKYDKNFEYMSHYCISSALNEWCASSSFEISENQIYLATNVNDDDTSNLFGNYNLVIGNDTLYIDTDTFHSRGDYILSRFDLDLQPLYSKSMGGRSNNSCLSLKAANNSVYLFAESKYMYQNILGNTVFDFPLYNSELFYLAKLDDQFNTIWFKRVMPQGWGHMHFNKMELGNNIILLTFKSSQSSGCSPEPMSIHIDYSPSLFTYSNPFLYAIDTNGTYKWRKTYFNIDKLHYSKYRNTFLFPSTYNDNQIFGSDTVTACFNQDTYIGELELNNGNENFVASLCADRNELIAQFSESPDGKLYTSGITYSGYIELPNTIVYPNLGLSNLFYSSLDSIEYFPQQTSDVSSSADCSIYPNPCQQTLHVKFPDHFSNKLSFSLFDFTGRQLELPKVEQINSNTARIHLGALQKGNYFLRVNATNDVFTKMFSVE